MSALHDMLHLSTDVVCPRCGHRTYRHRSTPLLRLLRFLLLGVGRRQVCPRCGWSGVVLRSAKGDPISWQTIRGRIPLARGIHCPLCGLETRHVSMPALFRPLRVLGLGAVTFRGCPTYHWRGLTFVRARSHQPVPPLPVDGLGAALRPWTARGPGQGAPTLYAGGLPRSTVPAGVVPLEGRHDHAEHRPGASLACACPGCGESLIVQVTVAPAEAPSVASNGGGTWRERVPTTA